MKSQDRKSSSLCEESMLVLVNILKFSSISLARRAVVPKSPNHHQATKKNDDISHIQQQSPTPKPQRIRGKRSQKPEQPPEAKQSYVILPENDVAATSHASSYVVKDGRFAEYIRRFHEKKESEHEHAAGVEGKAEDFIKKFHEKNRNSLSSESMRRLNYIMPPPPRQVFKSPSF